MAVYFNQYQKTKIEVSDLAGFSRGSGSRIADKCEKMALVKNIGIGFRKGSPQYPILMPEAYEILGVKERKFYGKGAGHEHILCQHLIAGHLAGYKPTIELNRNDKFIDVAIEIDDILIAIEVAVTSVHERENIEKDIYRAKADFVIIACKNEKVLNEIKDILSNIDDDLKTKAKTCLVSEILNQEPEEFIQSLMMTHQSLVNT
jgi:very-short-patch-repair endonuclease